MKRLLPWLKEQQDAARREAEGTAGEGYTFYEGRADAFAEAADYLRELEAHLRNLTGFPGAKT